MSSRITGQDTVQLFVVSSIWPRTAHSVNAPPVVLFELVNALSTQAGLTVGLLKLTRQGDPDPDPSDQEGVEVLRAASVRVEELRLPPVPARRWFPWSIVDGKIEDFVPEAALRRHAAEFIAGLGADILMPVWTEWGTALLADVPVAKLVYYGNIDPKNYRIQTAERRRLGQLGWFRWKQENLAGNIFERLHLVEMRKYQAHGNVAANDVAYYAANGVPNPFYIQNIWIDRFGDAWREKRAMLENREGCRIIGNVGKLGGTANTLGMEILGRDVLPELRRALQMPFEVRILGGGRLRPDVARLLDAPEVTLTGFVDDIDEEILRANIFLGMNNAGPYKVCHTRYLHAWTLGACLVVHRDTALSMPEISHRENALMGRDAAEIADLIAEAAADPALRQKIGEAGYRTYQRYFTGSTVAQVVAERLRGMVT